MLAALRAAEEARLLTVEAGTLRWRHALTHEAVLALVPPERAMLHGGPPRSCSLAGVRAMMRRQPSSS